VTAMIQITDVTATTAFMPVSFHIMFIARSPKAATSDCRRSRPSTSSALRFLKHNVIKKTSLCWAR
jgi:hypothetical protein